MTQPSLPPEILGLSIPDRIALVEQIWDSIAENESEFQLSDAQKAELDRRLARMESSDSDSVTWADAKRRLLGES